MQHGRVQHTPILPGRVPHILSPNRPRHMQSRIQIPSPTFDVKVISPTFSRMQEDAFRMLGIYMTTYFT
ncbi:hypothetical protein MRB53_020751 [Persea americana]|uniref:Uncharacterized protein n=1 Tax=Persea americana TaxID=3435 RepID=A0ACC2L1T6_PERAE|nr:hypothetical protein MRB53_020751 [Persea americana]